MSKPTPKRIPSDDCAVSVDGELCYPHEGEWVELVSRGTVGEVRARVRFANLAADLDAAQAGENGGIKANEVLERHYSDLCTYLAGRIFAWNWTDDLGRPLPAPDGTVEPLMRLRAEELYWLLNAAAPAETEGERKNG